MRATTITHLHGDDQVTGYTAGHGASELYAALKVGGADPAFPEVTLFAGAAELERLRDEADRLLGELARGSVGAVA